MFSFVTFTTYYNSNNTPATTTTSTFTVRSSRGSEHFQQQNNEALRMLSGGTNIQANYSNFVQRRNMLRNSFWGNDRVPIRASSGGNSILNFFTQLTQDPFFNMGSMSSSSASSNAASAFDNYWQFADPQFTYENLIRLDENNVPKPSKATTEKEFEKLKRITQDEYSSMHPDDKEPECAICLQNLFRSYKV